MTSTVILRCGGYQGARSVHTRALHALDRELGRADRGVRVELIENIVEREHKAADLLEMVEGSALDLCYFSSSYLGGRVPSLRLLDLPFLTGDRQAAYRRLDGALGMRLADEVLRHTGFRVLAFWDNGFRHFSNRVRPIRQPQDCRGLRIRTLDSALHHEIFRALGFEPVTIDVKNLPAAVITGAVDAQENPLTNTVNFGLHRTHRHVSLTSHFFGIALLLVNRARFDSWPADVQESIRAAASVTTQVQRALAEREDAECLAALERDGCSVVVPPALDLAAFKSAVTGIGRRELARIDPAIVAEL